MVQFKSSNTVVHVVLTWYNKKKLSINGTNNCGNMDAAAKKQHLK